MTKVESITTIPDHVVRSRVRDVNLYDFAVPNGDPQLGLLGIRKEGEPETFWSPYNGGHWVVTRAATVSAVVNDADRFSNRYIGVPKALNPPQIFRPMQVDAPDHARYRRPIQEALSPRAVSKLREDVRALTIDLIERLRPQGHCEFMSDFSQHMPIGIFMSIMGLPESDRLPLLEIAEQIARPKYDAQRMEGYAALDDYSRALVKDGRGPGANEFIAHLCTSAPGGTPLSEEELVGLIAGFLLAGLDTVVAMMGFFARFFADNPDRRDELRDNPRLIPEAVEELLRRYSLTNIAREVRCDLELDGVKMRAGDMVVAPLILHNLDEAVFGSPLDIAWRRRRPPNHLSFGGEAHRCLGAMLARTELQVFLQEWLTRMPAYRIQPGFQLRARTRVTVVLESLPLVWDI